MDNSQLCKLFIGGLNVQTNEAGLRAHFEGYGTLTDCVVVVNPLTKRSRCFGFVTFSSAEEADAAVGASPHTLDGNNVELKRAVSREDSSKPGAHAKVNKLFVGGLKADIEENHLQEYFSRFGAVDKVEIIADKETGKKRGFGFIHFGHHDSADKAAVLKFHTINGHRVEVKKAVPREDIQHSPAKSFRGGRGRGGSANGFSGGREAYGSFDGYGGGNHGYNSYSGGYSDQGGYGNGFGNYSQHMSAYGPMKGAGAGGTWARNPSSGPYHGAGGYGGTGSYGSF